MASSRNPLRTAATAGVLSFAVLAGMSGLAHVATAATSSAHPDVTFIKECAGEQSQNPATYTLACADANQSLEKLRWSKWGAGVATATGMMRMNDCVPTCAGGKDRTVKVSVRADKLQQREASQTYGRLRVTVIGKAMRIAELFDVGGQAAIITGASSGLGRIMARGLADAGCAVVLGARREDRLNVVRDEIVAGGGRATVVPCDVRDPAHSASWWTRRWASTAASTGDPQRGGRHRVARRERGPGPVSPRPVRRTTRRGRREDPEGRHGGGGRRRARGRRGVPSGGRPGPGDGTSGGAATRGLHPGHHLARWGDLHGGLRGGAAAQPHHDLRGVPRPLRRGPAALARLGDREGGGLRGGDREPVRAVLLRPRAVAVQRHRRPQRRQGGRGVGVLQAHDHLRQGRPVGGPPGGDRFLLRMPDHPGSKAPAPIP